MYFKMSKLWKSNPIIRAFTPIRAGPANAPIVRKFGNLVPPSQYDVPIPRRLHLSYVLTNHWEISPLFVTTCCSFTILMIAIAWAFGHKVDSVFHTYCRENHSRTMDLRNPDIHKMLVVNQRYEPWPEMQDVLDKMKAAEHRALVRANTCSNP